MLLDAELDTLRAAHATPLPRTDKARREHEARREEEGRMLDMAAEDSRSDLDAAAAGAAAGGVRRVRVRRVRARMPHSRPPLLSRAVAYATPSAYSPAYYGRCGHGQRPTHRRLPSMLLAPTLGRWARLMPRCTRGAPPTPTPCWRRLSPSSASSVTRAGRVRVRRLYAPHAKTWARAAKRCRTRRRASRRPSLRRRRSRYETSSVLQVL